MNNQTAKAKVERYKSFVEEMMFQAAKHGADDNQLISIEREWFPKGWRKQVKAMSEEELTELEDSQHQRRVANAQRILKVAMESNHYAGTVNGVDTALESEGQQAISEEHERRRIT
jgi:hypothetical protein